MGSPCELHVYLEDATHVRAVIEAALAEIERLEQRYSRYRCDSLLSSINAVAQRGGSLEVDAETAGLFDYADTCFKQSDGLFDITSGVLREVWRFDHGGVPDQASIDACRARIGWNRVRWRTPRIEFPAGFDIDLGGVVKEYAVDRVSALLLEHGVRHGLVNLGGDVRVLGPHPGGAPWQIGVQHPRAQRAAGQVPLARGAVTTSGDYARCKVVQGRRYGHILNPRTGWPVRRLASVTVIAEFCLVAGSASTIAMLKEDDGPAWLRALGVPHLWVDVDGHMGGSLLDR